MYLGGQVLGPGPWSRIGVTFCLGPTCDVPGLSRVSCPRYVANRADTTPSRRGVATHHYSGAGRGPPGTPGPCGALLEESRTRAPRGLRWYTRHYVGGDSCEVCHNGLRSALHHTECTPRDRHTGLGCRRRDPPGAAPEWSVATIRLPSPRVATDEDAGAECGRP